MEYVHNDGGRAAAGYKGAASDCVVRAYCIVSGESYALVYKELNAFLKSAVKKNGKSSARTGVQKSCTREYYASKGWTWQPLMKVGSGCQVHLTRGELPAGRIIVKLSKHVCAVVDGVVHDTYDCARDGTRCVYGYWYRELPVKIGAKSHD